MLDERDVMLKRGEKTIQDWKNRVNQMKEVEAVKSNQISNTAGRFSSNEDGMHDYHGTGKNQCGEV